MKHCPYDTMYILYEACFSKSFFKSFSFELSGNHCEAQIFNSHTHKLHLLGRCFNDSL